jgi:hypothetical protein
MTAQRYPISTPIDVALRRLELCRYAVEEVHMEVDAPTDPEHKADLLLATENLTYEVLDLLRTVKLYAWGPESEEQDEYRETN